MSCISLRFVLVKEALVHVHHPFAPTRGVE